MTARPRSCPTCRSIGAPSRGCQDLWHIEVRTAGGDADRIAKAVTAALAPKFVRIERALRSLGGDMSELDDKLTELEQAEAAEAVDLARALGDLRDAVAGKLSADEVARFDALVTQAGKNVADIDSVDPAPAAGGSAPAE